MRFSLATNFVSSEHAYAELGIEVVPRPNPSLLQRSEGITRMMRKIFLAAVTEAWIFLTFPGSPAEINMQVYCKNESFSSLLCFNFVRQALLLCLHHQNIG